MYVNSDPILQSDPTGLVAPLVIIAVIAVVVLVGGLVVAKEGEKWRRTKANLDTVNASDEMWRQWIADDPPPPPGSNVDKAVEYQAYRDRAPNHGMSIETAADVVLRGWEFNQRYKSGATPR